MRELLGNEEALRQFQVADPRRSLVIGEEDIKQIGGVDKARALLDSFIIYVEDLENLVLGDQLRFEDPAIDPREVIARLEMVPSSVRTKASDIMPNSYMHFKAYSMRRIQQGQLEKEKEAYLDKYENVIGDSEYTALVPFSGKAPLMYALVLEIVHLSFVMMPTRTPDDSLVIGWRKQCNLFFDMMELRYRFLKSLNTISSLTIPASVPAFLVMIGALTIVGVTWPLLVLADPGFRVAGYLVAQPMPMLFLFEILVGSTIVFLASQIWVERKHRQVWGKRKHWWKRKKEEPKKEKKAEKVGRPLGVDPD